MQNSKGIPIEMRSREMSLQEFKTFLGPAGAARYTDAQLVRLQRDMREAAAFPSQIWIDKRKTAGDGDTRCDLTQQL